MEDVSSMAPEFFFNCSRKAYNGKQMNKEVLERPGWIAHYIQTTWVQFYARHGDTSANSFTHLSVINRNFYQCLDLAGNATCCGQDDPI